MKKYNLHRIMESAHTISKYIRLYSLTHGMKTWGDCMRLAWNNEKKRIAGEEARKAGNEALANAAPARRSSYDKLDIPLSAYYNPNSKGRFGGHYVGD